MSEFFQRLRRQAKELNALERDLRVRPEEKFDWGRTTMSSGLVGLGIPVERSFLADYFLTTWTEWRNLYERYPRYFGRTLESLPRPWHQTAYRCRELAERLMHDGSLGGTLAGTWEEEQGESKQEPPPEFADGAEVAVMYRSMVRNHLRLSALAATDTGDLVDAGAWNRCAEVVRGADADWKELFFRSPASTQDAVVWHLRHYRHAALALSWLNGEPRSTLDYVLREDRTTTPAVQSFLSGLNPRSETARRVIQRVCQAIVEIGYDYFVEDVTSKEFVAGDDSPVGSRDVLLVPGGPPLPMPGIVVAVSKGKQSRARLGFTRVMEQIKAILSEAKDQIRFLLLLCDSWDSGEFSSQHLSHLRSFSGLQFLILLVGSPDNLLAPLAMDMTLGRGKHGPDNSESFP
jgi:hypothetical protein